MLADVAQAGGAQQGVGHRVADDVGIGMAHQPARMLDPEPAQDQRPPLAQPMRVMTDSYPHCPAPLRSARSIVCLPNSRLAKDRSLFFDHLAIPPRPPGPFCHPIASNFLSF